MSEAYDNGFVPTKRFWDYEGDADCEALRQIARKYDYRGEDTLGALFNEMQTMNTDIIYSLSIKPEEKADLLNELPSRTAARLEHAQRCPIY